MNGLEGTWEDEKSDRGDGEDLVDRLLLLNTHHPLLTSHISTHVSLFPFNQDSVINMQKTLELNKT